MRNKTQVRQFLNYLNAFQEMNRKANMGLRLSFIFISGFFFFWSGSKGTFADSQTTGGPNHPIFHIEQMDKNVPVDRLARSGVQIHKMGDTHSSEWDLPSVEEREKAFSAAGLRQDVDDWDQLDRDMLYLRARDLSIEAFTRQYPKLSAAKLRKLHETLVLKSPTTSISKRAGDQK